MGRKPLDASDETVRVTLRLTQGMATQIDHLRGDLSRSEWLRYMVTQTVTDMHEWIESLPEVKDEPTLGKPSRKIRVEPIKKVAPEVCDHTWERAGSIFDRCTKCDARKRH
jgi:hypothetical protein